METDIHNFDELGIIEESVDGMLSVKEGRVLYEHARACPKGDIIVEVGSWKGKSASYLCAGSKAGNCVDVYCIDPFNDPGAMMRERGLPEVDMFPEFVNNMNRLGFSDIVKPIRKVSKDAVNDIPERVGVLFIDAVHEYEYVKFDWLAYSPKVCNGGVICFHDSDWTGVNAVLEEYIYHSSSMKVVSVEDAITCCRKR